MFIIERKEKNEDMIIMFYYDKNNRLFKYFVQMNKTN